ncbi:MAG: phosphoribosylaminoimidazolesuccinocarboxamide synthase [Candidatus Bilamarchaeaceae archaeon]
MEKNVEIVMKTNLDLPLVKVGKVRETYKLNDELLMVSTDRLSAFDVVFNEGIPYKGIVLNMLSKFWFEKTRKIIKNHFISVAVPPELPTYLKGRSMIVKESVPLKIECVVRGYITGSAWKEYQQTGSVCGIKLEPGLENGGALLKPIFTPSTKAEKGHDENITFEKTKEIIGENAAEEIMKKAIKLYEFARDYALKRGLVLADTKFEFGYLDNEIILIDEILTPDSSRYWLKEEYEKGNLVSMDKQFVRDFLEKSGWNKSPPPPQLPQDVIMKTSERYMRTYEMLTGRNVLDDVKKI